MSLLVKVLVALYFVGALIMFFDAIYRIDAEADYEVSWKEKAVIDIITLLVYVFFLAWMKVEGWW